MEIRIDKTDKKIAFEIDTSWIKEKNDYKDGIGVIMSNSYLALYFNEDVLEKIYHLLDETRKKLKKEE